MQANQRLRDRLAEIDSQIALLEAERKIVRKKLCSLTYPVVTLPFEVTSEIFVHCLSDFESDCCPVGYKPTSPPFPLILSHICRAWRQVAFKTPKLWASFCVYIAGSSSDLRDHAAQRRVEWIERAGSTPLSIALHRQGYEFQSSVPSRGLPLLEWSAQWRSADLRLWNHDFRTHQFQSLYGKLPILERLEMSSQLTADATPVRTFEEAPHLRVVVLRGIPPSLILLPWAQLTHFEGHDFHPNYCHYILRLAGSLVDCTFIGNSGDLDHNALLPPHPRLEALKLTRYFAASLDLLRILTLPVLVQLDYFDEGNSAFDGEDFASFMARSRPPLQRLSLREAFAALVQSSPFLHGLNFLNIGLSVAEMSSLLILLHDLDTFLPMLESFQSTVSENMRWTGRDPDLFNFDLLLDVLTLRWQRNDGPRLESFQMDWRGGDNEAFLNPPPGFRSILSQLQDFVEEGMHISIIAPVYGADRERSQAWI
ncbi:hypothetical protein B0H11DRAFT_1306549 [Mycena galericulata]|nr:hypothetical protein B0H11DRAFT_1306549 [Mycena galericulata]